MNSLLSRPVRFLALAILSGAIFGAVAAAALARPLGRWQVSMAFAIDQRPRQETADYAYDGYYALKASELFADTLAGWFRTPSVVRDLYHEAALPLADEEAARAAAGFRLKRYSSQVVVATFTASEREDAQALADAAAHLMSAKTEALNRDAADRPLFTLRPETPVIAHRVPSPLRYALAGALAAGALAAGAIFFAAKPRE